LNKTYSYADYLTWQFQEKTGIDKGKILRWVRHQVLLINEFLEICMDIFLIFQTTSLQSFLLLHLMFDW
jgi:hypothetical protein